MRVVFDPNVIISATPSPGGTPALLYELWRSGAFEVVVSPKLLWELEGVLAREKFADLVHPDEIAQLMMVLTSDAALVPDPPEEPEIRSADPNDDYLIALASHTRSVLVSGDKDLLELSERIPVYSPADFRVLIEDAISDPTQFQVARSASADVKDQPEDFANLSKCGHTHVPSHRIHSVD